MKKVALFLLGFITLFTYRPKYDSYNALVDSFTESGMKYRSCIINSYIKLNDVYKAKDDIINYAAQIYNNIDSQSIDKNIEFYEDNYKVIISGENNILRKQVQLFTFYDKSDDLYKSYVIIEIIQKEGINEVLNNVAKIGDQFKDLDIDTSICIIGYIDGYTNNDEKINSINKILKDSHFKLEDTLCRDELVSVCAYSNKISNYILCCNNKININIASKYSSYDNKTYYYFGSPLISIEY